MKKLLIFLFISFMSFNVVSAISTTNNIAYWTLDNVLTDATGNGNTLSNNGATYTISGKINGAYDFDGVNDFMTSSNVLNAGVSSSFTINQWINSDNLGSTQMLWSSNDANPYARLYYSSSGSIFLDLFDGSNNPFGSYSHGLNTSTWYFLTTVINRDTDRAIFYLNGVEKLNFSISSLGSLGTTNTLKLGSRNNANFFNGRMDEVSLWDISLSNSQILELYNSGLGLQYPYTTSTSITFNNPVNNQYLNNTSFLLNVSFSQNTNSTYSLNSGTITTLGTNTNESIASLTGIEGLNTIQVFTNTNGELSNSSINFTIDTINPIINNNLPIEINSYNINFSEFITINETNPYICILEVLGQGNTTCNNNNFNFAQNGNNTINIYVNDSAGNVANSLNNNIFVNPQLQIQVRDNFTDLILSDWSLGEFSTSTDTLNLNVYDLGLGSTTLEFVKQGYNIENKTISLNTTSEGLITLYNNPVTLQANVYSGETLNLLSNFDVQIKNSTNVVTFTGLTNLSKLYNEIPTGDIELTFSSTDFSNALFYTTIDPFTSVNFDVYLTPSNLSSIFRFTVTDVNTRQFLEGVTIEARRSVINETVSIQQTKTGGTGIGFLILDELKDYEFIFSKQGYSLAVINSIPTVTDFNIRLNPEAQTFIFLNGVNARFFPSTQQLYKNTSYNFSTQITGDSITRLEYTLKDISGNVIDSVNTTNPTGETFTTSMFIPENYNQSKIISEVKVFINGNEFIHSKEWNVGGVLGGTLKDLRDFGQSQDEEFLLLKFFIVIISYVIVIVIGNRNPITRDFVSMLAILPTVIFTYLGWIPLLYGTVITIALFVLYVGGNKRG